MLHLLEHWNLVHLLVFRFPSFIMSAPGKDRTSRNSWTRRREGPIWSARRIFSSFFVEEEVKKKMGLHPFPFSSFVATCPRPLLYLLHTNIQKTESWILCERRRDQPLVIPPSSLSGDSVVPLAPLPLLTSYNLAKRLVFSKTGAVEDSWVLVTVEWYLLVVTVWAFVTVGDGEFGDSDSRLNHVTHPWNGWGQLGCNCWIISVGSKGLGICNRLWWWVWWFGLTQRFEIQDSLRTH